MPPPDPPEPAMAPLALGSIAPETSAQNQAGRKSDCEPLRDMIVAAVERGLSARRIDPDLVSDQGGIRRAVPFDLRRGARLPARRDAGRRREGIVRLLAKQRIPAVRAIQHMVHQSALGGPNTPWHLSRLASPQRPCQENDSRPLLFPRLRKTRSWCRTTSHPHGRAPGISSSIA
jgi:hypothetical protein